MLRKMLRTAMLLLCFNFQRTQQGKSKVECGYKQCPSSRDGALNVHLIPHSHMDAGWVKTFEEYYYGTRTFVSTANVQLIYHSVLSELLHDKRRKFTFSETAYFWRWWKEQRPTTRATFRTLVQEGRIEFASGGWVQNDEATLDYLQIIDHYTWGLRKLNETLGPCGKPKAAWQIDTYGHTREQASLLAQMGYDGLFIGRVDHKEREAMMEEDRMEFMWRGSDVLGKMSDIMTHTMYNLYNAPDGFCFDFLCSDEPIVDDPDNRLYNADKRVQEFINQIERQARYYEHDNILVTMGGDFTFQSAANWFINMDKLINHVNTHPGNITDVNIFYSTPSCYLKAIYLAGRRDKAIYTQKDDLLPYGSDPNTYWVGFYSSRPNLKYLVRRAHEFVQVVKQLAVMARMNDFFELHLLRHAVNLLLHHDAITGTSQQHVTNDYVRILSEAMDACTKKVSHLLSRLTPTWGSRRAKNTQQFAVCHQLNISQCWFTERQEPMLLIVYNPQSTKTYHHVCIPATSMHYSIRDCNDDQVEHQLVPLPAAVINLPGRVSSAIQQLCFEAENIPALGYTAFYLVPQPELTEKKRDLTKEDVEADISPTIHNEFIKVTVNKNTGMLESISNVDGVKIDLTQNFYYYSQNARSHQSGAYSFRPDENRPTPVTERVSYHTIVGPLVSDIRQIFSDWITQVIRLYRGREYIEFDWIVGPVPIGKDLGKEVVSIFRSNISSGESFYTDSNGRAMLRRTCWNRTNHLPTAMKPVAACYYPVTSRICIQSHNTSTAMCVLTDRTQGGTSYSEGEIELMVHRRLFTDDGFGLEEPLNEEEFGVGLVVKGTHRLLMGNYKKDAHGHPLYGAVAATARRWRQQPWLFLTSGDQLTRRRWQNVRNKRYSLLRPHGLPRHVHILTLEPWKGGAVLLRVENTLERGPENLDTIEDIVSKKSFVTVNLREIFMKRQIKALRETTLAANQWLDDARQMDWSTRYVYNGSDDDIMVEDYVEYNNEKPIELETFKYSGISLEDYAKGIPNGEKFSKKNGKMKRPFVIDRKKRFIPADTQITANIDDNIINGTFGDREHSLNSLEDKYLNANISVSEMLDIDEDRIKFSIDNDKRVVTHKKISNNKWGKSLKNNGSPNKWRKPRVYYASMLTEEPHSDEDISKNLNKRISRKTNISGKMIKPPVHVHATPDDITRSIYDMYYKSQQPRRSKSISGPVKNEKLEEPRVNTKSGRMSDSDDYGDLFIEDTRRYDEESQQKREKSEGMSENERTPSSESNWKRQRVTDRWMAESLNRRQTYKDYSDENGVLNGTMYEEVDLGLDFSEDIHGRFGNGDIRSMEVYDNEKEDDGHTVRQKRAPTADPSITEDSRQEQEQADQSELDYVITLRPTQIRTFVVWFEPSTSPPNTKYEI